MSHRLFFTYNRPANVNNHYVVGSGVGSKSRFVRSALRRRSSNNAQGKPCCNIMPNSIDNVLSITDEKTSCTNGKVWKECGSACTATCDDPTPLCTKQCVAKCECPMGQYLEGEKCITSDKCPVKEDMLTGTLSSTSACPTGWKPFNGPQDASFCCLSGAFHSGCTDINAACYLSGTDLKTLCPNSSMVNCNNVKYKCDTTAGKCLPNIEGTQTLEDCSKSCSSAPPWIPPNDYRIGCTNCAKLNTKLLVQDFKSGTPWEKEGTNKLWSNVATSYFGCNDPESCYFNAVDIAKLWILGTDDIKNTTVTNSMGEGGCNSCMASTAFAMQEGGNQVDPTKPGSGEPSTSPWPRNMWDPTFSTSMCNKNEKCPNGGPWQASSAWINANTCCDCNNAMCSSIENPLCAARISMWHGIGAWTTRAGAAVCSKNNAPDTGGGTQNRSCNPGPLPPTEKDVTMCTAADMQFGINPNCYFGPFGLCTQGWNASTCNYLYRKTASSNVSEGPHAYFTFGRIAINACRQAKIELQQAGWTPSGGGECNVEDKLVLDLEKDHTDGIGDWAGGLAGSLANPCMCDAKKCYSPKP